MSWTLQRVQTPWPVRPQVGHVQPRDRTAVACPAGLVAAGTRPQWGQTLRLPWGPSSIIRACTG